MIPVNEPLFSGNEKKYLMECIDTGWISSEGPFINKFEKEFSSYLGLQHGIAVSSGTSALETALYAIGIEENDEIIMPSFTIISCALASLRLGAKPVLVDIDPEIWTMNVKQIENKITKKTKAIMAVHIYGHPVDMDPIFDIAKKYNLKIVEDSAEVHGAEYFSKKQNKWLKCGAMSDISATSFYANKIISTGEGGMVVTNNSDYAQRAKSYRNLCFSQNKRFLHDDIGYNFRMTNIQAALGLAQLEKIDKHLEIKIRLGNLYRKLFSQISGIRFMVEKNWAKSVFWMYCIELDSKQNITAEKMMSFLKTKGIGSRPFFRGLHQQPALLNRGYFKNEKYLATDNAYKFGLYLPSGLTLTNTQINEVVNIIKEGLETL